MDQTIFKKMKVEPSMTARIFDAPPGYPTPDRAFPQDQGPADFVHLFVGNRAQFEQSFPQATAFVCPDGLFWVSYPKTPCCKPHDLNRDILWDMVVPLGWHPVAQVSLDDTWSAIRLRPNEPGESYARPGS